MNLLNDFETEFVFILYELNDVRLCVMWHLLNVVDLFCYTACTKTVKQVI